MFDFIFPQRCIGCDDVLEPWEKPNGVCTECIEKGKVRLVREPLCKKCGRGLKGEIEEYCENCRRHSHGFVQAKAVYFYSGETQKGMYRFKYSNRRSYARVYAKTAVLMHRKWLNSIKPDVIIPVPMFKNKERERGYNQATVFANELSKVTGLYCDDKSLTRIKNTTPLKFLDMQGRQKDLKDAFSFNGEKIKYKTVLLVDDILTTGATVDEVCKVLHEAGVDKVYVMTVCVGEA